MMTKSELTVYNAKQQALDILIELNRGFHLLDYDKPVDCADLFMTLISKIEETKSLKEVLYETAND